MVKGTVVRNGSVIGISGGGGALNQGTVVHLLQEDSDSIMQNGEVMTEMRAPPWCRTPNCSWPPACRELTFRFRPTCRRSRHLNASQRTKHSLITRRRLCAAELKHLDSHPPSRRINTTPVVQTRCLASLKRDLWDKTYRVQYPCTLVLPSRKPAPELPRSSC